MVRVDRGKERGRKRLGNGRNCIQRSIKGKEEERDGVIRYKGEMDHHSWRRTPQLEECGQKHRVKHD